MKAHTHPKTILDQFERLADDWTTWSILTSAVVASSITVAGLMLAVVLDMAFQFEAIARMAVLSIWISVSIAAFFVFLVRALRQRRSHEGMARRLERIFPQLSSDLINLVQLSRDHAQASITMRGYALHQAADHAAKVPLGTAASRLSIFERFRQCMQTPRDLAGAMTFGLLLALCGGILHVSFPAWPHSVYRLFRPGQFVPAIGLVQIGEVVPGNCEILSGTSLTIIASVENPGHRNFEGVFVRSNADGSEQRLPLVATENGEHYSLTLPKVTDPFRYRLEIGRTQTEHFTVAVYDRPSLRALAATYKYPAYTGLPEKTIDLSDGTIEAPQFTTVDLSITTVAPVVKAIVAIGVEEHVQEERYPKDHVRVSFPVIESGFYTVSLTDAHNGVNTDPPRHRLVIAADQPPRAEIISPGSEILAAAGATIAIKMEASDDYGISMVQLLSRQESQSSLPQNGVRPQATEEDSDIKHKGEEVRPLFEAKTTQPPEREQVIQSWTEFRNTHKSRWHFEWKLPTELAEGTVLTYRLSVRDNRQIVVGGKPFEPQTTFSLVHHVRIVDRASKQAKEVQSLEKLRQQLWKLLKRQTETRTATVPATTTSELSDELRKQQELINSEQRALQHETGELGAGIAVESTIMGPFKSVLTNLAAGRMKEASAVADDLEHAADLDDCHRSAASLVLVQDDILDVLRKLLDVARAETSRVLAEQEERPGGDLPAEAVSQLQQLRDKLKDFLKQQRKVIEASEELAKQPVEDFTKENEKELKALKAAEDDWSKFMTEKHSDLSKLPEQDFSNPSLLEELIEVANELKMASDALTQKSVEIAVPLEQLGAEMAEEMTTNIEKWLPDTPDRERWKQEEPLTDAMREAPMAELPHQLEDIVGDLMEQEEDLFDEMEDVTSSWADSIDKGAGWDAMDGPISNNSARGVTGNRLPNTSEIGGRSGEGRQGKSSGEFVGDSAVGKGGRNTPSRLTPDPFEAGQVKDSSTDPVGGATGGGKSSGQGGEGLEGPVPPGLKHDLGRLADKQATLRNKAESIRLQFKILNYNTAGLDELAERMRQVERQLREGFFRSALRRRDLTLGRLADLRTQTGEAAAVKSDASTNVPHELRQQIMDSMAEKSPDGWEDLNKSYFKRLATGK